MGIDTTREEAALDALLRTAIEHDSARPGQAGPIRATPFVWQEPATFPGRAERQLHALLSDPVGSALRHAVRRIGEHLYALAGNQSLMHATIERVADMDPPNGGYRLTIMDHAWDGIGSGDDRWWA